MQKLYVANWKMNKTFNDAINFCLQYKNDFKSLVEKSKSTIVICPSFPSLYPIAQIWQDTPIKIGAQTCSEYQKGAYTGQVSAQSLHQAGCSYCITGHSEQRTHRNISDAMVADQVNELIKAKITPIVCIGETFDEHQNNQAHDILEKQLHALLPILCKSNTQVVIAYEPIWAIGSGQIPSRSFLNETFQFLHNLLSTKIDSSRYQLLYGGSVDQSTISELQDIPHLGGFLIGSASLDFQKFEKIVLLGEEK